ncbi:hypothetical protein KQX54_019769 [Cotesia glomerata]|uniref:Uncharacterized protein n=1 Tax=Cotesia glomerata TaxID=32391 RepID=A0AAV7I490_COTGL|nr:hypothetical protein KQX54_019769 [Cotesia glomerata]
MRRFCSPSAPVQPFNSLLVLEATGYNTIGIKPNKTESEYNKTPTENKTSIFLPPGSLHCGARDYWSDN